MRGGGKGGKRAERDLKIVDFKEGGRKGDRKGFVEEM